MYDKAVAFMYEGSKYVIISGDSYLCKTFPKTNAITMEKTMSSNSVIVAISRPWGVNSPYKIPMLDKVCASVEDGYFVLDAYLHVSDLTYSVSLNKDTYEVTLIDSLVKEPESAETAIDSLLSNAEEVEVDEKIISEYTAEVDEKIISEYTVEVDTVDESSDEEDSIVEEEIDITDETTTSSEETPETPETPKTGLTFGRATAKSISFGVPIVHIQTGDSPVRVTENNKRGIIFGIGRASASKLMNNINDIKGNRETVPEVVTATEVKAGAATSNPAYVYVVNKAVDEKATIEEEEAKDIFDIPQMPGSEFLRNYGSSIPEPEEKEEKETVEFTEEQREVLTKIPTEYMRMSIMEYTQKPVVRSDLETNGPMYCIMNKWYGVGDWYVIDIVPNMSRYYYNKNEDVMVEIPRSVSKAWLAQHE